jgi:hypothetical protein
MKTIFQILIHISRIMQGATYILAITESLMNISTTRLITNFQISTHMPRIMGTLTTILVIP